jgi:hypothetical protein
MKNTARWVSVVAVNACLGCGNTSGSDSGALGKTEEAMKYDFWLTDPASVPISVNPFAPATVAGSGSVPPNGLPNTDANRCNVCTYTKSTATSAESHVTSDSTPESYANRLWTHGGTGSLRTAFTNAIPKAREQFTASFASPVSNTIKDIIALLKLWPGVTDANFVSAGGANPAPLVPSPWFRGFQPTHTRMLAIDNGFVWHPDPFALEELRYRGARTFCAMREAARHQDLTGKYSQGVSTTLPFIEWRLGEAESTVAIGKVWKDVSSKNANIFVIPIAVGSRIAPLQGPLVPSPGQIVHPISWITGDSIVVSAEDNGQDAYVNSQHADGFLGQYVGGTLKAVNLPLFTLGFLTVTGEFDFEAEFGRLLSATTGDYAFTPAHATQRFVSDLARGRGYEFGASPLRTHKLDVLTGGHYRPGFGLPSDSPITDDPPWTVVEDDGDINGIFRFIAFPGAEHRIRSDDDRAISVGDRIREKLSVKYAGGFNFNTSILSLTATVSGTSAIDLNIQRLTTIREQVSVVPGEKIAPVPVNVQPPLPGGVNYTPQSNVIIVPETKKDYTIEPLKVELKIHFKADFPGPWDIEEDYTQTVYELPSINLGSNDKQIGDEASRFRIGSFTDAGLEYFLNAADYRSTYSHLPQPGANPIAAFASFPDPAPNRGPESVGACINDTSLPPGNVPPPKAGKKGDPPQNKLCVYGPTCPSAATGDGTCAVDPWAIPSNICTTIPAYLTAKGFPVGSPIRQCMNSVLSYLCSSSVSPPPRVQPWANLGNVIARSVSSTADIANIQMQCVGAFNPVSQTDARNIGDLINNMFHYGVCNSSWQIQGEQAI